MHIVVAQTVHVILYALIMMKDSIFRVLEVSVHPQCPYGRGNPDIPPMIPCDETHLMTFVNRETFQIVAVADKYFLAVLIVRQIIDASSESSNPNAPSAVLIHTIYVIITQAIYVFFPMPVARQLITHSVLGLRFYESLSLCRNPKVALTVLIYKIDISLQRSACMRYGSGLGQVSALRMVVAIHPQLSVFQSYPKIVFGILAKRTHFVAQRFVAVRFRSYHTERRRLKSYFLQSFGMRAHPQITLPVGKGRMDLVGEPPVCI